MLLSIFFFSSIANPLIRLFIQELRGLFAPSSRIIRPINSVRSTGEHRRLPVAVHDHRSSWIPRFTGVSLCVLATSTPIRFNVLRTVAVTNDISKPRVRQHWDEILAFIIPQTGVLFCMSDSLNSVVISLLCVD